MVAAIVAFAFHDTRRPDDELVFSTDASTGEGEDSSGRHGARHFERGVGWDAEKWRYSLEQAIGARDFACSNATTHLDEPQVRAGWRGDFENLPHSMVFPLGSWQSVLFGRWSAQDENIRLEGWAFMLGVRHTCRTASLWQFTLCDDLALTLALATGCSSTARLNAPCCE